MHAVGFGKTQASKLGFQFSQYGVAKHGLCTAVSRSSESTGLSTPLLKRPLERYANLLIHSTSS